MSFCLEFYSLSWDALKMALAQRKPELIRGVQAEQWDRLLDESDLAQNDDDESGHYLRGESVFVDALEEMAEAMARPVPAGHDPVDLEDHAALLFAAIVRQLGKPMGTISHQGSVVRDRDGELPIDFRVMFLDGVAGSCFKDHALGEKLAARPLFGLFHLEFLSWGGLARREIDDLLRNYAPPAAERSDEEWLAIADQAQGWLDGLVSALRNAAAAKTDLVTLYLTTPEHFGSFGEKLDDELRGDSSFFDRLRSFFGR